VRNLSKTTYLLDKNDYEQYRDLFFYSFDEPESDAEKEFLKREFEHSKVYGIKDDGQLQVSITCGNLSNTNDRKNAATTFNNISKM